MHSTQVFAVIFKMILNPETLNILVQSSHQTVKVTRQVNESEP